MKKLLFAATAGVFALWAGAASASPVGTDIGSALRTGESDIVNVADYKEGRKLRHRNDGSRHDSFDWNDRRYSKYQGWHRYHSRPRGWRDRGCVAIGPIWFCP